MFMRTIVKTIKKSIFCIAVYFAVMLTACQSTSATSDPEAEIDEETITDTDDSFRETEAEKTAYSNEESEKNNTIYTEPPVMYVCYGEQIVSVFPGSCEWNYQVSGDVWSGVCADAAHPLDQNYADRILYLDPAQSVHEFTVNFDIAPTTLEILTYWPAPAGTDALPHQSLMAPEDEIDYNSGIRYGHTADLLSPNAFLAFEGAYIYEIYASFKAGTYDGDAYYSVLIQGDADTTKDK